MALNLMLAESALELVPDAIRGHPSVRSDAKRRGEDPSTILLDRSLHHAAMLRLKDGLKRGRPDLVHLALLSVTSTPLYQDGELKVYIHTGSDVVLELSEGTRPPKSYPRFRNLVEKLLQERPSSGLITVSEETVQQLLRRMRPELAVGLSVQGQPAGLPELCDELVATNSVALVGAFAKGHFDLTTVRALDRLIRIGARPLDAHVVAGRLVYEMEKSMVKRGSWEP